MDIFKIYGSYKRTHVDFFVFNIFKLLVFGATIH